MFPATAKGFGKEDGGYSTLAAKLAVETLGLKHSAAGINDVEVIGQAGAVAFGGKGGRFTCGGDGTTGGGRLRGQGAKVGEGVLHLAKRLQYDTTIAGHCLFISRAGSTEIRFVLSAIKDGHMHARAD